MRVLQLIDTLEAGGAEQMAVNFANALSGIIDFSALAVTRKEGILKQKIAGGVGYFEAKKKSTFDFHALWRLRQFIIKNKIGIVHAHGTSFFTAVLLKITLPHLKIVWHEHYGARAGQSRSENLPLLLASLLFSAIFTVNRELKGWAEHTLMTQKVFFIPNFVSETVETVVTRLSGEQGKRIVLVANLKKPKNHITAVKAFYESKLYETGWTLHFIGKDFEDAYSIELKEFIRHSGLVGQVIFYGLRNDIRHILSQADIGMLTSTHEGFPVALLEYGNAGIAVISTDAGFCPELIEDGVSGLLFSPNDMGQLKLKLLELTTDKEKARTFSHNLKQKTEAFYKQEYVMKEVVSIYENF